MTLSRRQLFTFVSRAVCAAPFILAASSAQAWGDKGHMVVGLIADHYLSPAVRDQVQTMLATDKSGLTNTDIAAEATWADKYRSAHRETATWHFVDNEIDDGDIDRACFGYPTLPHNTPASAGTAQDCVVNKINQFTKELRDGGTAPAERLLALQFLLHFVGDLHQPLHSSDAHDRGGNDQIVSAAGMRSGKLHSYWDTAFVKKLGDDESQVASALVAKIGKADMAKWRQQTPRDWSLEAFDLAKIEVYGKLPAPDAKGRYRLPDDYVANASSIVATQLSRAGVRLANVLNDALGNDAVTPSTSVLASPF